LLLKQPFISENTFFLKKIYLEPKLINYRLSNISPVFQKIYGGFCRFLNNALIFFICEVLVLNKLFNRGSAQKRTSLY